MLNRFRRLAALVIFTAIGMTHGQAEEPVKRANFSGRWRMIKEQSDFGKFSQPDIIVRIVDQHDPTLNVHTVQTSGKVTTTSDVSYFLDGREASNVMSGRNAASKAFWDGSALMIRTETKNSKGEDTQIVDRWELSPDGQVLTTGSHIETPNGEVDLKLVSRREDVSK